MTPFHRQARLRFGATMFATDRSIAPADLARALEERGFDSLYLPEHTHIPTSRRTPAPTGDPILPDEYSRCLDPFVALATAAAVTNRLRVGTGVCLVAQRDPIVTAKAVATLDHLSGGRFVLGAGYGWNIEEMEDHGVDPHRRRARAREHLLAMQRLWSDEAAAFEGEFVRFPPCWSWPKPLQRPRPPVLLGGAPGPTLFQHIAELADGWIPIGGAGVAAALPALHEAMHQAGRDPATLQIVLFGVLPDAAKVAYYESLPVTEVIFRLPSADREQVLPALDRAALLIAR
jgi:probable F420-dependent oxidoreductase